MEKIEKYINECNFTFTTSPINDEHNYDAVKLVNLVSLFNTLYISFMKEYDSLDKFDLGEKVIFINYNKIFNKYENTNSREIILYILNPHIIDGNYTYLYLKDTNNKIDSYVTNKGYYELDDTYSTKIDLDEEKTRKYLVLFDKYELLFQLYHYLRNENIYKDDNRFIHTSINKGKLNFFDGLKEFELTLGVGYQNNELFAKLMFDLGERFNVDYSKSELFVDGKKYKDNIKAIDQILNDVCVNKDYLREKKR